MDDFVLFTPGPVTVPHEVSVAGSKPMYHHRTPEFSAILESTIEKSKHLFSTENDVLLVHSTGRGAMEGALRNLLSPGERILCICNGKFGEMFGHIGKIAGLDVVKIFEDWENLIDTNEIDQILKDDSSIRAVTMVHSDTSNAIENPVGLVGKIVREHNRLFVVDCISSLGAMPFFFNKWFVDVAITSSQKGLMAPAGISLVALSERAWKAIEKAQKRSYYIDFNQIKKFYDNKRETPGSTPVSLVEAVEASLNLILDEGISNVYKRHRFVADAIRAGAENIGLELFPKGLHTRSSSVSAFSLPDGIYSTNIRKVLRGRYGILIAAGLGEYVDSVVRIGHIGKVNERDVILMISALELILYDLGVSSSVGEGLMASNRIFSKMREEI